MSVATGADGNCQSNVTWDTSSQSHNDIISPPTLGSTVGGWTPKLLNSLSTTVTGIKSSAGQIGYIQCWNPNASVSYIQLFDALSGSVTLGSTVPKLSIGVPPTNSTGFVLPLVGVQFASAISTAVTTTATGNAAPSTAVDCNAAYN
jgi:hypothetical protein